MARDKPAISKGLISIGSSPTLSSLPDIDFQVWAKFDTWPLESAVSLFFGKAPKALNLETAVPYFNNGDELAQAYVVIFGFAKTKFCPDWRVTVDFAHTPVRALDFVRWAVDKNLAIHPDLREHVYKFNIRALQPDELAYLHQKCQQPKKETTISTTERNAALCKAFRDFKSPDTKKSTRKELAQQLISQYWNDPDLRNLVRNAKDPSKPMDASSLTRIINAFERSLRSKQSDL